VALATSPMAKRPTRETPLFDPPEADEGTGAAGPPPIETVELTDAAQARYLNYPRSVSTARAKSLASRSSL